MPIPTMVSENVSQNHSKKWNEKYILDVMMSIYLASITSKGHNALLVKTVNGVLKVQKVDKSRHLFLTQ